MTINFQTINFYIVCVLLALGAGWVVARNSYNVHGAFLLALAFIPLGAMLIKRMTRVEPARWFLFILVAALVLKMLGALARMSVNYLAYGGLYDAGRYHRVGSRLAGYLWHGDFARVVPHLKMGTAFTEFYAGLVHAVIGPSVIGAYLVFGVFAYIGSFFFYRAFCVAFPNGNRPLYATLVFLYPSVLYWSNGLGKDALMALFIGVAGYGGALLMVKGKLNGLLVFVLGAAGAISVRPHVAVMVCIGLLAAYLLGKGGSRGLAGGLYRVVLLVAGIGLLTLFMPTILTYVGVGNLSLDASSVDVAASYFDKRQTSTFGGGSAFAAPSFTSPTFVPIALSTILFRPFPWEAHNLQALMQAFDGTLLLGLFLWRAPRVTKALLAWRSYPYVMFIVVYTLMLAVALMTVANFGTLARERAMLLPLVLMLVAFQPTASDEPPREPLPTGTTK